MLNILAKKRLIISIIFAVSFGLVGQVAIAYYPVAYLSSTNLLSGQIAVTINSFDYTVSAIPAGSDLKFQFSVDNTNWYNSSGTPNGWDSAANGSNLIDLSNLEWAGESFYYKGKYTSSGANTAVLDDIALNYTSGSNSPPDQPTNSSPTNGVSSEKNPVLTAGAYSDTENDSHSNTQWQVDDDSDFSSPVWTRTAGVTETSTTVNSANGTFANELSGGTALTIGTTYYWRARYSDGNWSSWSVQTSMAVSAYYPSSYLVSANILSGRPVSGIDSFIYNLSEKPSGTTATAQFSQDGSTWYDSSGVSGSSDTLSTGSNNTIDLSGLSWSGANFYYRIKFSANSGGSETPVLDDVSIVFTATAATWDGSSSDDWSTDANWDIGSVPGNYHDIVIPNGGSPVLASNEELGNLTIQAGGTLDLNGYDLTLNDNGSFSNNGTLRLHGDETITSFTNDTDSGTVEYDGTGTYTSFPVGNSYYNIRFANSGNWTSDGNFDVNGAFTMTGGTFQQSEYKLNIAGNMTIDSGATFTKSSNGSLLIFDGDLTLEIEDGTTNLGSVQIGTSPDTTTLSGALIVDSLTIATGDSLVTNGYNVIVGTGGITNSGIIVASGGAGGTTSISTASGFVNHGTFTAGSSTLTLSGSLINKGTFTANTGSVVLDGTSQTLSGSTTFYNLTKIVTSADTLTFTESDTFTILNTLKLQGVASNLLSLRSSTGGIQWNIDPQGTRTIGYLDVKDSNNANATAIDATGGTNIDSGNNTSWTFTVASTPTADDTTTTTSSGGGGGGGSRGGRDSPGMLKLIADAYVRILALQRGGEGSGKQIITQNDETPPSDDDEDHSEETIPVVPRHRSIEQIAEKRGRLFAMVGDIAVIYKDVLLDQWYTPFISYVIEEEIATGYTNETGEQKGEFGIANPVTVAELLKMSLEAADIDLTGTPPPRNLSARGMWASAYVAKGEELQLSILTSETDVYKSATRGEVVQVITEVLKFPLLPVWTDSFTDVSHSHRNARAIATAVAYEIIKGDTDENGNSRGMFRPDAPINRAEVSKIIALVKEAFR